MDELNVLKLYNESDNKKKDKFSNNLNSELRVKSDYDRVTCNFEWLELMEDTIPYIDNILRNPNRFIINEEDVIKISAKNNIGIEDIKEKIKELFNVGTFMTKNLTFFTNVRQISLLKSAINSLEDVEYGIKEEREIDMIEIDLKLVWEKLGDIIGANYTEELVDNLFSIFCL